MKKGSILKICNFISIILLVCFVVKTIIDYINYSSIINSAPFHVWIIINSIYFIVPAIIIFVVGIF